MSVFELSKNSMETLRFQVSEYKGREYVDVRIYYLDDDGSLKPTRKGVTVSPDLWPEFLQGVEKLGTELEQRGLLEKEDEDGLG